MSTDPVAQMAREDRAARRRLQKVKQLQQELWQLEKQSQFRRAQARRQMIAIAQDLLPQAAGLARKGRPRLLAICARIIGEAPIDPKKYPQE